MWMQPTGSSPANVSGASRLRNEATGKIPMRPESIPSDEWLREAWRLPRPGKRLVFLGNHPLSLFCSPLGLQQDVASTLLRFVGCGLYGGQLGTKRRMLQFNDFVVEFSTDVGLKSSNVVYPFDVNRPVSSNAIIGFVRITKWISQRVYLRLPISESRK